jgi:hypothetical protein
MINVYILETMTTLYVLSPDLSTFSTVITSC